MTPRLTRLCMVPPAMLVSVDASVRTVRLPREREELGLVKVNLSSAVSPVLTNCLSIVMVVAMTLSFRCDKDYADALMRRCADALMDAGRGADGCREGDDHGAFLLANGRWMQELVGFRSPLVARATADEGVSDARRPPGGAQQLALVTMVQQISLREI